MTRTNLPEIMGIVNVTPDSFSDGGAWFDHEAAVAHALHLVEQGATIIDVGGESTRPGAEPVSIIEEQRRVIPVVTALAGNGVRVSVDTLNAETARAAIEAGAAIINDVSGGLADEGMLPIVADAGVDYVVMHWRGRLSRGTAAAYTDVVDDVLREIGERIDAAQAAGISGERLIVDPGLGFSKDAEHNWQLLAALPTFQALGLPVLVGASRKRFLATLIGEGRPGGHETLAERDAATAAISMTCARQGVWGVRVHNVEATRAAMLVERELEHHGLA